MYTLTWPVMFLILAEYPTGWNWTIQVNWVKLKPKVKCVKLKTQIFNTSTVKVYATK